LRYGQEQRAGFLDAPRESWEDGVKEQESVAEVKQREGHNITNCR